MAKSYCPSCDAVVISDHPRLGGTLRCRDCGAELEIISTAPFEVDYLIEDEWDDDESEEDD